MLPLVRYQEMATQVEEQQAQEQEARNQPAEQVSAEMDPIFKAALLVRHNQRMVEAAVDIMEAVMAKVVEADPPMLHY